MSKALSRIVLLAGLLVACAAVSARAQTARPAPLPSSELSRQNFGRVAASAAELKTVLVKDAGLMVELKRWVAKDATDHGQIVSDSDLSNDAIYDRLESDVAFRSVATALVQRYGYLLPQINPDSEQGKERELLIKERAKWQAQDEEEQLTKLRQQDQRDQERTTGCDPRRDGNCTDNNSLQNTQQGQGRAGGSNLTTVPGGNPPSQILPQPAEPLPPPSGGSGNLERAQMMQTGAPQNQGYQQLPADENYDATSLPDLNGMAANARSAMNPFQSSADTGGAGASGGGQFEAGNPSAQNSAGASSQYSLPMNSSQSYAGGMGANGIAGSDSRSLNPFDRTNDGNAPGARPTSREYWLRRPPAAPEMVQTANPYRDVPSLYDMYLQATPRPATPQRFGAEVFENGTRDPQLIPMDLPAGPDYVVGPGDGLSIDLWGGVSQRFFRVVDREGRVSLPEAGPVLVSGKTMAEVQQNVQQILRTQYRDVSADVSLARLRTIRIYEVGDVAHPGAYDISSLSTPLNALFIAGGPTPQGSLRVVKHYRGDQLIQEVDLYDLLLRGVRQGIAPLENGDTVQVPPIGPQVTVEGMVRRPAIYELHGEKSLASVLDLAGGLLPTATLRHIEVQRVVAHEKKTMLSLDVPEDASQDEARKKLEAFDVQDGDRVRIFPIAPYNQDVIYLEGHVLRPGRYSYRSSMRVTDVIASYKDLLPEPSAQYAEIIRLNPPDFRPSVQDFDLADALANPAQAPVLEPMDTVRIFSRYDFENPPSVSVWGDVRAPGTYPTSGQIHLSDAVHLAGGLAPDAATQDAQVFRSLPNGEFKILSVRLDLALAGDPKENVLLESRDRLLVHKSSDAVEPATVYVQGEVAKPGRYPLTAGMTVGDLIRVGGGLAPGADTQTADLTHFQWANDAKLGAHQETLSISAALTGDAAANPVLHNGDVLAIRQLPGWNDLGASITLKGEVQHPGTYGIRPGERLSSVIERAGGFQSDAYPYGAVLQRTAVRELETKSQDEMLVRLKDVRSSLEILPDTDDKQKQAKTVALQQAQSTIEQLSANPPVGRVAIRISSNVDRWKSSASDVEVRAGDVLTVPKRPSYVMITGQVFNPTAVSYRPGKSAKWYLGQSGGPTQMADKKGIFVIRADGSVIGKDESLWSGSSLGATLEPGDTVVVPERAIGGGVQWQNIFLAAQVASSIASSVFIAVRY
ncbi:MAG: SLBB domain-containing protein [Candidatus Acidiferrales bacterium]